MLKIIAYTKSSSSKEEASELRVSKEVGTSWLNCQIGGLYCFMINANHVVEQVAFSSYYLLPVQY